MPLTPKPNDEFTIDGAIFHVAKEKRKLPAFCWVGIGIVVVGLVLGGLIIQGRQGEGLLAFLATPTVTITPTITPAITPAYTQTPTQVPPKVNTIDGMTMVYIPAGEFEMGSEEWGYEEMPIHTVYLDAYWIYQTEVTKAMFAEFLNEMGNNSEGGVTWLHAGSYSAHISQSGGVWQVDSGYGDHPVVMVSWYGAQAYCKWAGGALPTEAQWEKAARGGLEGKVYPWGDQDPVCTLGASNGAQYYGCGGERETIPVGSFAPNGYGLYDMAGNVLEWVADWYSRDYYAISPYENPSGPSSGSFGVARGGSWCTDPNSLRAAYRFLVHPVNRFNVIGFRCVFSLP